MDSPLSTSTSKVNDLYWLSYTQAIMNKAKIQPDDKTAFFITSESLKGPLGGEMVPSSYTNTGIHHIGDYLLPLNSTSYRAGSTEHSYVEALDTYLNFVDLGSNHDPNVEIELKKAIDANEADKVYFTTQRTEARAQFQQDAADGFTKEKDIMVWIRQGNFPSYYAASDELKRSAALIAQYQTLLAGGLAKSLNEDHAKIRNAQDTTMDNLGYNMVCSIGSPPSNEEVLNAQKKHETLPDPPSQRLPLYEAPSYIPFIRTAQNNALKPYDPKIFVEVNVDTGKDTSDYHFGQENVEANVGFTDGWFSIHASGGHESTSETLNTHSEDEKISITMTFEDLQVITITPGSWNLDITKYKLRSDAPQNLKEFAKPTGLLVASRMGCSISVGRKTADELNTKLEQATSAGGSVSVFGIPIGLGASGSSKHTDTSHVGTWDDASMTFKVEPKADASTATVLAVIGEKFSVS